MKHALRRIAVFCVKLSAALATCWGCSGPSERPAKPSTPKIRWQGQESGYRNETPPQSPDRPN